MDTNIESRLNDLKLNTAKIRTYHEILSSQLSVAEADASAAKYKSELYVKVGEIFKLWLEDSMQKNVKSISDLVTTALGHIVNDQKLEFKIKQEPKYNRIAMSFVLENDGTEGDPLTSYGGGLSVIISTVLRLAIMAKMGMGNLLLLDESMVALANVYVPAAASFLRQLAEQTGVNILMVTHNNLFLEHAHVAYEGTKEQDGLKLRRVRSSG